MKKFILNASWGLAGGITEIILGYSFNNWQFYVIFVLCIIVYTCGGCVEKIEIKGEK
jgi:hypothetical protein